MDGCLLLLLYYIIYRTRWEGKKRNEGLLIDWNCFLDNSLGFTDFGWVECYVLVIAAKDLCEEIGVGHLFRFQKNIPFVVTC